MGWLASLPRVLPTKNTSETDRNETSRLLYQAAIALDKASKILRESLSVLAIFVSPIGMMYWSRECQQFVNILTEVCQAQPINFSICAPNLPVVKDELRPVALSYHAYLATVSRVVQATEPRGNAQLTLDGCFDNRENRI